MKRKTGKGKSAKGAPSGFVISLLVHGGAIFLAASIFMVVKEKDPPYITKAPVQVDRKPMDLIKLKPRIEKNRAPAQRTELIVSPEKLSEKQILALPPSMGRDSQFTGVPGIELGFDVVDPKTTLVGDNFDDGFGFQGTFYDFKRDRKGRPRIMDPHQFITAVSRFVRGGWKPSILSDYYRSPKTLYATSFMIPPVKSSVAPAAFDEPDTGGYCWLAHYKGNLVHQEDITFRFWGHGDDILLVRVGKKVVLVACWPGSSWETQESISTAASSWQSSSPQSRVYTFGNNRAVVGDWITLKKGESLDMEVLFGEVPGGTFCSMLTVEVKGETYPLNREQCPILPMFKTGKPSLELQDQIYEWLTYDHAAVLGGPLFRDINPIKKTNTLADAESEVIQPVAAHSEPPSVFRNWTVDGKTIEAEYIIQVGDATVLKMPNGRQVKVKNNRFASEDMDFVELENPPEFNVSVTKQTAQRIIQTTPYLNEIPPKILAYTFGAKIKQVSAKRYTQEIFIELFTFGQQRLDDRKYMLLDHQLSSFVPSKENQRSHVLKGEPIELVSYDTSQPMGRKYSDYLLILTDSRGEVIQYSSSSKWIYPNLDNLRKLKKGNFLDQTCMRVSPTGPGPRSLYY